MKHFNFFHKLYRHINPKMKLMLLIVIILMSLVDGDDKKSKKDHHFDLLVFTQHWPYTTCLDWEERRARNKCTKIGHASWTVHGLWPNQYGKIAPGFCNSTWKFDPKVLEPIMEEMMEFWPDVEMRGHPDSLWDHEWSKHGTCATQLKETKDELSYFSKGCELAKENPITEWLEKAGVVPTDAQPYSLDQVWGPLIEGTGGARPHIDCHNIEGQVYLSEIKVCYNKNFTRSSCDGIKSSGGGSGMMGKCTRYSSFYYPPNAVPPYHLSNAVPPSHLSNAVPPSHLSNAVPPSNLSAVPLSQISSVSTSLVYSSGLVGGIVCTILALCGVGLAAGYIFYRRCSSRGRGYESL